MIDKFYDGQNTLPECSFNSTEEDMNHAYNYMCRKKGLARNKEINDLLRKCIDTNETPISQGWLLPEE